MLKKDLYVIRSLSCGTKFTIQQYGALCHTSNSVTWIKMSLILSEKKTDLQIPVTSICLICYLGHHEKDTHVKWYEDIEGLSAAISYAWDRLTKNSSIIQLTNGGCDSKKW